MAVCPGGQVGDVDLGQTRTHSGAPNLPSLVRFCIALFATAVGTGSAASRLAQAGVVLTSVASLAGDLATDFTTPEAQAAIAILMSASP
jgi:hypothetical protein